MDLHNEIKGVFERRHAHLLRHYMAHTVPLVREISGSSSRNALDQLDDDLGVITGLLDAAVSQPGRLLDDISEFLKLMSPYFDLRGLFQEQLDWAQALLQYFRSHTTSEDDAIDMSVLLMIASMYHRFGEHDDALDIYQFILTIDRHRPTHPGFAVTYHSVAIIYLSQGKQAQALEACRKALEIDRHNENAVGIANELMLLADILEAQNDIEGAKQALAEAYEVLEPLNNRILQTNFTDLLASFAAKYHSAESAELLFQQAIAGWRELDDKIQLALAQFNYAVLLHETGRVDAALQLARESLSLLEIDNHFRAVHVRQCIHAWEQGEDAPASIPSSH